MTAVARRGWRNRPGRGPAWRTPVEVFALALTVVLMPALAGCPRARTTGGASPPPTAALRSGAETEVVGTVFARSLTAQVSAMTTAPIDARDAERGDSALADATPVPGSPVPESSLPAVPLISEASERSPTSPLVTITIQTEPPKRAHVFWGAKDLGLAPLEIKRPRASGPLDLIVRAPGYLTFHTRAFTDRDDKIAIPLVPETEAPRMFGYRAAPGK